VTDDLNLLHRLAIRDDVVANDGAQGSSFDLLNAGEIEPGVVAHHWSIHGTSSGKGLSFKGASIIHVEGDKIRSDECYFDRKALE
jgi:hypothetical protein